MQFDVAHDGHVHMHPVHMQACQDFCHRMRNHKVPSLQQQDLILPKLRSAGDMMQPPQVQTRTDQVSRLQENPNLTSSSDAQDSKALLLSTPLDESTSPEENAQKVTNMHGIRAPVTGNRVSFAAVAQRGAEASPGRSTSKSAHQHYSNSSRGLGSWFQTPAQAEDSLGHAEQQNTALPACKSTDIKREAKDQGGFQSLVHAAAGTILLDHAELNPSKQGTRQSSGSSNSESEALDGTADDSDPEESSSSGEVSSSHPSENDEISSVARARAEAGAQEHRRYKVRRAKMLASNASRVARLTNELLRLYCDSVKHLKTCQAWTNACSDWVKSAPCAYSHSDTSLCTSLSR